MPKLWTKDEEREQLRKIAALIEETEPNSYIRFAFAGCVRIAEENIDNDFANSYPDMLDHKDKEMESLSRSLSDKERELEQMREVASKAVERCHDYEKELTAKDAEIEKLGHMIDGKVAECERRSNECVDGIREVLTKKDVEIMRLKAEIYDLRKGCVE